MTVFKMLDTQRASICLHERTVTYSEVTTEQLAFNSELLENFKKLSFIISDSHSSKNSITAISLC